MRSSRNTGLAVVVIGLLIPLSVWGYYGWFVNWTPVRRSVPSLSGDIEQRFRVNYTSTYSGRLEFTNHSIPSERLECFIGLEGFALVPDCRDQPTVLHFSWKVFQDGRVVDSGTYGGQGELIAVIRRLLSLRFARAAVTRSSFWFGSIPKPGLWIQGTPCCV